MGMNFLCCKKTHTSAREGVTSDLPKFKDKPNDTMMSDRETVSENKISWSEYADRDSMKILDDDQLGSFLFRASNQFENTQRSSITGWLFQKGSMTENPDHLSFLSRMSEVFGSGKLSMNLTAIQESFSSLSNSNTDTTGATSSTELTTSTSSFSEKNNKRTISGEQRIVRSISVDKRNIGSISGEQKHRHLSQSSALTNTTNPMFIDTENTQDR